MRAEPGCLVRLWGSNINSVYFSNKVVTALILLLMQQGSSNSARVLTWKQNFTPSSRILVASS